METLYQIPEHDAHLREKKLAVRVFSRCFLGLFFFLAVSIVLLVGVDVALGYIYGTEAAGKIVNNIYFIYASQIVVMYMIAFPIYLLITMGLPVSVYERRRLGVGEFFIYFLITQFLSYVGSYITTYIEMLLPDVSIGSGEGGTGSLVDGAPIWLIILLIVIIGPIVEELIFRKVLLDRLSVFGDRLALIVSTVAFGLFHGNLDQLIYTMALGFTAGLIYLKTRDIRYTILLHMLANFIGTVPPVIAQYSMEWLNGATADGSIAPGAELGTVFHSLIVNGVSALHYGTVIAGLVLFIISLIKRRDRLFPEKRCRIRIGGMTLARSIILNPGSILFVSLCLAEVIISIFIV